MASGQTERDAVIEELRAAGSARMAAQTVIRTYFEVESAPQWRVALLPITMLVLALGVPSLFFIREPWPVWFVVLVWWLAALSVLTFIDACYTSRKLLMRPFGIAFGLTWVALAIYSAGFSQIGITSYSHDVRDAELRRSQTRHVAAFATRVGRLEAVLKDRGDLSSEVDRKGRPDRVWGRHGEVYLNSLKEMLASERSRPYPRGATIPGPDSLLPVLLSDAVAVYLGWLIVILVNLLILGCVRIENKVRQHFWRPENMKPQ
jgi:hypothetical protein